MFWTSYYQTIQTNKNIKQQPGKDTRSFIYLPHKKGRTLSGSPRRGEPDIIWYDNGSNFVSVEKELKQALQNVNHDFIGKQLALRNIEWKFIPSISPWMGGAWEIMVKLTKRALKTVTNDSPMYEEVLRVFLVVVESTLNSRPLTLLSDSYNDLEVLTPNHFLLGKLTKYFGSSEFPQSDINSRNRWKSVQALANMFWTRFIKSIYQHFKRGKNGTRLLETSLLMIFYQVPFGL